MPGSNQGYPGIPPLIQLFLTQLARAAAPERFSRDMQVQARPVPADPGEAREEEAEEGVYATVERAFLSAASCGGETSACEGGGSGGGGETAAPNVGRAAVKAAAACCAAIAASCARAFAAIAASCTSMRRRRLSPSSVTHDDITDQLESCTRIGTRSVETLVGAWMGC